MSQLFASIENARSNHLSDLLQNTDVARVQPVIGKHKIGVEDLALLLSPGGDSLLEPMAQRAAQITDARFGNAIGLYAPLYVSNKCNGGCPYCGFKRSENIKRVSLNLEQIRQEGEALRQSGIQHVLLVSGDCKSVGAHYLVNVVKMLKEMFPSVTVEVPPLDTSEYSELMKAGVDGVTLYQETYDVSLYERLHSDGPKRDYYYRLNALERAGEAGMRKLNTGALWGLAPWRLEALRLGIHAKYLERKFWRSQVLIGMPRLHQVPADYTISHPVSDEAFVRIIVAIRMFCHDAQIVVSTREKAAFRDNLIPLGVRQFSAGSKTHPGGYSAEDQSGSQFEIDDHRSPRHVEHDLFQKGYDPVFKDWDVGYRD